MSCANDTKMPRPEYPLPQMVRSEWMNLNGTWEFTETDDDNAVFLGNASYPDEIIVPFCRESELSGLGRKGFVRNVWYKKTFSAPEWKSPRTRLHIGACDYRTKVWMNGQLLGEHVGGSAPIVLDVTSAMKSGENTIIVHAFDDTRSELQPCGKQAQSEESHGCVYTRTTGIWQTVWLEGVGSSFISDFRVESDPNNSRIIIQPEVDGLSRGLTIKATACSAGKEVGSAEIAADWRNGYLVVDLSEKHLWSNDDPFLYGLKLTLSRGNEVVDEIDSYFGLRKISIEGAAVLINDKPVFQRLVLDQGFYPDGIWTAPTDEALKHDIRMSIDAGFNGARLHEKVFDPRYLYWADTMGYLVWGEFPNWGLDTSKKEVDAPVIREWVEVLRRDRNHPSIIGWCPFNETPAEAVELQNTVMELTKAIDPSRPVIDTSGWTHDTLGLEINDNHDYDQNPETFRERWMECWNPDGGLPARYSRQKLMPFFISEYGGIGWDLTANSWGYGEAPKSIEEFYARYEGLTDVLLNCRTMFGFCYTQITDVEQEKNGIYTYDRKPKFDIARIKSYNAKPAAFEQDPAFEVRSPEEDYAVAIGSGVDESTSEWKYTTEDPGNGWVSPDFNGGNWKIGKGGFGDSTGNWAILTQWQSQDIWLRQEFDAQELTGEATMAIRYSGPIEVYLNGELIWQAKNRREQFIKINVTEALRKAMKPEKNVIAVHTTASETSHVFDMALLIG